MELSEYLWGRHPLKLGITRSHLVFQKLSPVLSKDPIVVQLPGHVQLFTTSWTAACQASLFLAIFLAFVQVHVH